MTISVALAAYNGEKYIKEQLKSILNQNVPVDEIVICDDRSNDKTTAIIEELLIEYPNKISLHKNQVNLGSSKNFEKLHELLTYFRFEYCNLLLKPVSGTIPGLPCDCTAVREHVVFFDLLRLWLHLWCGRLGFGIIYVLDI